jgi:hypothetical protein
MLDQAAGAEQTASCTVSNFDIRKVDAVAIVVGSNA